MKILQLSSEKNWRGGEQQIAYLIEELVLQQEEVLVVCRKGSAFEKYCKKQNIPFKSVAFRNSVDFVSAWQLKNICKDWNPDLLHAHSAKSLGLVWLAGFMGNKIPVILSRRVAFDIRKSFINRLKLNMPRLRKIICVTEAVRQKVLPFILDKNKATVVFSGIDINSPPSGNSNFFRQNFSIPKNAFLIGTTAAFTKEKDYETFFRTAQHVIKEFPNKPIVFVAIGEGPELPAMQKFCKTLGIEDKICFTGFIPEVKKYLQELDIFLFTSRNEGLGSSILDAFACKLPVVSTAVGGVPEIIQDGKTGLLAPIGNHIALAQQLEKLLKDPALSRSLGNNAYLAVQQFDKKVTAEKTIEIYRKALNDY